MLFVASLIAPKAHEAGEAEGSADGSRTTNYRFPCPSEQDHDNDVHGAASVEMSMYFKEPKRRLSFKPSPFVPTARTAPREGLAMAGGKPPVNRRGELKRNGRAASLPRPESSLEVAARAAAVLFGRPSATSVDRGKPQKRWHRITTPLHRDHAGYDAQSHGVANELRFSRQQREAIIDAVALVQPLICDLRRELSQKESRLAALSPAAPDFVAESARLSSQVGTLAAQVALISSKLKTDVYALLTPAQYELLSELRSAFELPEDDA